MVSYNKKQYGSVAEARADSQLFNGNTQDILAKFNELKASKKQAFDQKFEQVYGINQDSFDSDPYLKEFKAHGLQFAKEALSDLLGGISYFYGPIKILQQDGSGKYDGKLKINKLNRSCRIVHSCTCKTRLPKRIFMG